ncbi:uncharacterized protein LOC127239292 [Andrographis paniculata]|uniref:uncharacterized protein LOC127239292 n=1 Tax=Andrographis paniculata TaxID=175694 RepID=UPI0021E82041|nr:uncharacterized protein LOC127239292 [Andrographis paniculata]
MLPTTTTTTTMANQCCRRRHRHRDPYHHHQWLFLAVFCAALLVLLQEAEGSRAQITLHDNNPNVHQVSMPKGDRNYKDNPKRGLIGSVAPTCTYNECRGCRYKCRAEQVPVEGNDPINSAYHYKCVCHR